MVAERLRPEQLVRGRGGVALQLEQCGRGARLDLLELVLGKDRMRDRVCDKLEAGIQVACQERAAHRDVVPPGGHVQDAAQAIEVGTQAGGAARGGPGPQGLGGQVRDPGLPSGLDCDPGRDQELDLDDGKARVLEGGDAQPGVDRLDLG